MIIHLTIGFWIIIFRSMYKFAKSNGELALSVCRRHNMPRIPTVRTPTAQMHCSFTRFDALPASTAIGQSAKPPRSLDRCVRMAVLVMVGIFAINLRASAQSVASVSAGSAYTMFLMSDGSLRASGYNLDGQLGDGTYVNRSLPVPITTGVASVSAGVQHTLFVKTDGTLWGMGNNAFKQLAFTSGTQPQSATPGMLASGVTSASTGGEHTTFLQANGTLSGLGRDDYSQLGFAVTFPEGTPSMVRFYFGFSDPVSIGAGVSSVSAGTGYTLFIKNDKTLWATGYNLDGQLGNGTTSIPPAPTMVATDVVSVAADDNHTLFIKTDGTLWGTGKNNFGQLGDGTMNNHLSPIQVASGVASVSAGGNHTLFIKTDGTLWATGRNDFGQLGDGTTNDRLTPVQVATGVASVSAGGRHTLFIKTDGSVWGMGANDYGQLGDGTTNGHMTPVPIRLVSYTQQIPILTQPQSQDFGTSYPVTFTVTTHSSLPQTYQWLKDGVPIAGATLDSYDIPSLTLEDAGVYTVAITNVQGSTLSEGARLTVWPFDPAYSAHADFNGDRQSDIVWRNTATGVVSLWLMDDNLHVVRSYVDIGVVSPEWQLCGNGDFNHDGKTDLIWRNTRNGVISLWLMNGTKVDSYPDIGVVSNEWQIVGTGDFNRDGQTDVLWRNTTTGLISLWLMNGTSVLSYLDLAVIPLAWKIAGTGDYNGDGLTDILWQNSVTGVVSVWYMNGTTVVGATDIGQVGPEWKIECTGNFNFRGSADIVWRNSTTNVISLWLMINTTPVSYLDIGVVSPEWQIAP